MYYFIGFIISLWIYYNLCPIHHIIKHFFTHILYSLIILYYFFPVILEILNNPIQKNMYIHADYIPYNVFSFLTALHIYHKIYYNINYNEIYYYILSIYFQIFPVNKFLVASIFFTLGIADGISYLMLIFVKYGYIRKSIEKKINLNIILWFKVLGILFSASLIFVNIYKNNINKINNIITIMIS